MVNAAFIIVLVGCVHVLQTASQTTAVHFVLYSDSKSWSDAEAICEKNGGQLTNIQNVTTYSALSYLAKTTKWQESISMPFWLGLHKSPSGTSYKWSDCANLTTVSYWMEPDTIHKFDTACVRADHQSLRWFPSSCDDKLQYLCQVETGSCTYETLRQGKCLASQASRMTTSAETEAACQASCDTFINSGERCWAYYFQLNGNMCILIYSEDPFFCDVVDASVDGTTYQMKLRRCYNLNVSRTTEWSELNSTSILLDCEKNTSRDSKAASGEQTVVVVNQESNPTGTSTDSIKEETESTTITSIHNLTGATVTEPTVPFLCSLSDLVVKDDLSGTIVCPDGLDTSTSNQENVLKIDSSLTTEYTQASLNVNETESPDYSSDDLGTTQEPPNDEKEMSGISNINTVSIMPSTSSLRGSASSSPYLRGFSTVSDHLSSDIVTKGSSSVSAQFGDMESSTTEAVSAAVSGTASPMTRLRHVMCTCVRCFSRSNESTAVELQLMVAHLKVDKKSLSSTRRKLITATDNRPSAKTIGCMGVVFIIVSVSSMVLSDLTSLLSSCSLDRLKTRNF